MATPQASSRLELLQARFQQKQLQEKEQKLLQLYDQQQQRAYQVVQRGSAGSNGSNHGSSINQHTVTKTTTTSHTTSTSQGGKVRQMFDERRQTTVKGIDRSYPLEPLENKPRKQTNGNVAQKNGNLTVNRQSVTVKRVARADVNSNLNGGKPIVSYHEEITRESYGPAGRQQSDDDEFGNENHINQYANGNQTHIEEVLDDDTVERNRMMAKLHLMEYDETLKHRVKNDLESEEFPEDFMVDVPDKLPKQSVSKKLSQAEARLERFKHANAKRNNSVTKNPSTVPKKRSDPILPAKSTSSEDEGRARIRGGSSSRGSRNIKNASLGNVEETSSLNLEQNLSWKNENPRFFYKHTEELTNSKGNDEGISRTRRSGSPKFFCKESDKSATTYAIDSRTREKLSPEFTKNIRRRSESPKLFDSKFTKNSTNQLLLKNEVKRSESPKFFCKESEKSATTYTIDSRTREKLSPEFTRNIRRRSSPSSNSKTTKKSIDQLLSIDKVRRSESPKFFCNESEKSATTYAIDSKTMGKLSPEFAKNIKKRSESPKFFCKESEKSATTYAIDSKTREKLSPEFSTSIKRRSDSPDFFDSKTAKKSTDQLLLKGRMKRSESPKFFCKESEKSATTYAIDSKTREKLSPEFSKNVKQRSESPGSSGRLSPEFSKIISKRSTSPKFFCKESEKSATTYAIDSKTREKLSPEFSKNVKQRSESPSSSGRLSPEFLKIISKRSDSPKFFCKESEKSATTYAIDSKTREKLSPEFSKNVKKRSESPGPSGRLFPEFSKIISKRSTSPKFFCKESEKSATTYAIDSETRERLSPEFSKNVKKRSGSPKFYCKESEKSATTFAIDSNAAKDSSSKLPLKDARRSESPKFFCRESEKSATTYAIDSRSRSTSPDFIKLRPTFEANMPINSGFNIDTLDRQINRKSKNLAQTFSPKAYQKIETEVNTKSTRNKMPNVFERLTRRGSSPKCLQSNVKDSKFSKSPDITDKIPSPDSKSLNLTRKLTGRSSTSPQFFTSDSERSATIMLVTPETIVKRKSGSLKSDKIKENSITRKPNTFVVEPVRRLSEEIIDESSKHNIRSSVSRFFSEQCEKASRNSEDGTIYNVQSVEGGWSRDSSSLSLRDTRTSPRSTEFPGKSIWTTSADSIRDWSSKSRRSSGNLCPEFLKNKNNLNSTRKDLIKQSVPISLKGTRENVRKSKSKSPDVDRRSMNVLRSTRLIRDAIKRQSNKNERDQESRRSSRNEAGISITADLRKKVETCGKVERSRTPSEVREPGSSPKSSTFVEVDAEIQEITMPDQYVEHLPRKVNAKSRDKTRRSSAEKLFTYSVRKPERKKGSLFESSVVELSKRDQEQTDDKKTSGREGKYTVKSSQNNLPPTNNFTFRCLKRKINGKIGTENTRSREERTLDEYNNEEDDGFKCSERNWSSSPSPTSNFTCHSSKPQMKGNKGVNRKIGADIFHSREEKVFDEYCKGKYDKRSLSSSPSPTNNLATRGSKHRIIENGKTNRKIVMERLRSSEGTVNTIRSNATRRLLDDYNKEKSDIKSSSPSPTICISKAKNITKENSRMKNLNSQGKKILNKSIDLNIPGSKQRVAETGVTLKISQRKTPSPVQSKQKKSNSKSPQTSKESQILRSMELVRKVIKGESLPLNETKDSIENKETRMKKSDSTGKSSSTIVYINGESSNYKRTDSVESALRRFDSIGAEFVQSDTEKRQTVEESKAISLKALDRIDANLSENLNRQPSLKEIPVVSGKMDRNESKAKCERKFARARDSIEIARIVTGSKSPACKRKLFQDDSGEETETGSVDSCEKYLKSDSKTKKMLVNESKLKNEEIHEPSLSVKQLRSIEDIRKSIEPCFETRRTSTKSAIANNTLKLKRLPRRSENFGRMNDALGDAERSSIKCAIRFSRVTKSPSPDSTKTTETSNRARRNVLSSPSKSPDIVTRRSSTEMKTQETRSTKRPALMKGVEPIGNRKTTSTTTTSTRKSTDVVDGAILENGVHLRDQTAETKYDNDSTATKKSSAFVIDFDEQPPKENDAPLPRKSLLRKQSTDKQTPSIQTGRPPSSISSASSGSSMQGQVSGIKGKMASKAKTSTSGAAHRASTGSKSGGNTVVADSLVPCKMCGRRFAQDRVTLHEQICTKTTQKKRKQFDTMMYRVKGTDLEPFVKRGLCRKQPEKSKKPEPKSNWRRKHEDFINAIRSAKQVQAHLAAGGKLSDLPPPPASDTSDYIQCPHCGRKFNQSAAERHIPKCEHMLHNKPIHVRAPKPKR